MEFHPLYDRVLIRKIEQQSETNTGIILPGFVSTGLVHATVVEVGCGKLLDNGVCLNLQVERGDKVMVDLSRAQEIVVNGEQYYVIHEREILGLIFEDDETI